MKELKEILYGLCSEELIGNPSIKIAFIESDSRKIKNNTLFVAIPGCRVDGHKYISKAIQKGATAILCEKLPKVPDKKTTYVVVKNTAKELGVIASNFYDHPSGRLKIVGITGTNGKTTIACLMFQVMTNLGIKAGLLSTIEIRIANHTEQTEHTTPDILTINRYFSEMIEMGCTHCFMEVSSHGITQHRISGIEFKGGVFTNLSHDHLDYHKSFDKYRDAKKYFFDQLPKTAFALVNIDDRNGKIMVQNTRATKKTYALKSDANYRMQVLESQFWGLKLRIGESELWTSLVGRFNAYNILALYAIGIELGLEKHDLLIQLSVINSIEGRFQKIVTDKGLIGIVDYAHTPDALENVLKTIAEMRKTDQKMITVIGCGGNRDREKRPKMGKIASLYSNKVIFTSDNPRDEDPKHIIEEMKRGVHLDLDHKIITLIQRKQAIEHACQLARARDIVLIAGKGHEHYQTISDEQLPFDDFKLLKETLTRMNK